MHEHAMIAGLIRRVTEIAAAEKAQKVTRISVWLGALSHMSPGHFAEHFTEEAAGSIAAGAELDCIASDDPGDPRALDVVVTAVEVET
ncbi:MAG TPA: hydrogenase/urease maturation nickel metallochaperone HypA [Bauldia sp.]|nr:hydrogenase/urease maturation nickel metallochaperone HypA [Bauldia sp.]